MEAQDGLPAQAGFILVHGETGAEVPGRYSRILSATEKGGLVVLTPDRPLLPNTRYQLADYEDRQKPPLQRVGEGYDSFTTGTSLDTTAPTPLSLTWTERSGFIEWGDFRFHLSTTGARFLVVEREGSGELDHLALYGTIDHLSLIWERELDHNVSFGQGACLRNWPGAEPGASAVLRFGAFDLSGNFSGWTQPDTFRIPLISLAGCGLDAWHLVALALLVVWRWTRRKKAPVVPAVPAGQASRIALPYDVRRVDPPGHPL